jgi:two-component system response regulator
LVVASDGQEALDYLYGTGVYAGRDTSDFPTLTLVDLKLPKVSGLDALRRIRAEVTTRRMPVVILTSSREEQDMAAGYDLGSIATSASRWILNILSSPWRSWGCIGWS